MMGAPLAPAAGESRWADAERVIDLLRTRTERELLPAAPAVWHLCAVLQAASADLGDRPPQGAQLPEVGALAWGDLCAVLINDYRGVGGEPTGALAAAVSSVRQRVG